MRLQNKNQKQGSHPQSLTDTKIDLYAAPRFTDYSMGKGSNEHCPLPDMQYIIIDDISRDVSTLSL